MEKQGFSVKTKNGIRLSVRMSALADMVTPGSRLADVGCDHGYIPIYLCRTGRIPSAIAMDIHEGPLERARQHIEECGLSDRIQTRLSDGLEKLGGDEADTVLIAGMGGCLMCRILIAGDERRGDATAQIHAAGDENPENDMKQIHIVKNGIPESVTEFVLQPQSDISSVRRCIREIGFCIVDEDMVEEDGKFYPMMRAVRRYLLHGEQENATVSPVCGMRNMVVRPVGDLEGYPGTPNVKPAGDLDGYSCIPAEELADAFGPVLLRKRHPVLKRWLEKELLTTDRILRQLEDAQPAPDDMRHSPAEGSSSVGNARNFPAGGAMPARKREDRVTDRFRELLHKKELITAALSYYDDTRVKISGASEKEVCNACFNNQK